MRALALWVLIVLFSSDAYGQEVWASKQECDNWLSSFQKFGDRGGACGVLNGIISILNGKESAQDKQCLARSKAAYNAGCLAKGAHSQQGATGNSAAVAVNGKQQIYVFLWSGPDDPSNRVSVALQRANSYAEAERKTFLPGTRFGYFKRLDDDKCKKGFYILGMNNKDETGNGYPDGRPVSAFLNCGYKSLDDAITRGTRAFPIPFFNVVIGDVSSTSEYDYSLACGYDPSRRAWSRPAALGSGIHGNLVSNIEACQVLNSRYPILVDRQPEQTIWVTPQ